MTELYRHPQYGKYLKRTQKFHAHDEKNEAKAIEWFRRAAEQGTLEGMYETAWYLNDGKMVTKNEREAFRWWKLAGTCLLPPLT